MDLNSCDSSYDPDPVFTPGIGTPLDHIHRLAETLSDSDMPFGIKFFTLNATLAALLVTRQGDLCKEEFEAYCEDVEACYCEEIQARYPAIKVPQRFPRRPVTGRPDLTKRWSVGRMAPFAPFYWMATPGAGEIEDVFDDLAKRLRSLYLQDFECAVAALARAVALNELHLHRLTLEHMPTLEDLRFCIDEELYERLPQFVSEGYVSQAFIRH